METTSQEPLAALAPTAILPAFDWFKFAWNPTAKPQSSLVKLALTLEATSLLYAILRDKTGPVARPKPVTAKPVAELDRLLETLETLLLRLPATAPVGTILTLELPPQDAAYLRAIVGNKKRDERRYEQVRSRGIVSLDALMEQVEAAGEAGARAVMPVPTDADRPDRAFNQAEVRRAFIGLPVELAVLLAPLEECGGNVSELARRLGQPQRKTARQIARIRKHLEKLGLAPV